MTKIIKFPLFSPELRTKMCCNYGEMFVHDLICELVSRWVLGTTTYVEQYAAICPACGAKVMVNMPDNSIEWTRE